MARVELLEQELERAHERDRETRWLLAAALERIPLQLEAPAESTDPPETVEEEPERAEPRSSAGEGQESEQRPWWRRVFGVLGLSGWGHAGCFC
jgi:hypothetical protein